MKRKNNGPSDIKKFIKELNYANARQAIREVEGEIRACFDGWDGAIKNKHQPVPIQDLDFWSKKLIQAVKNLGDSQ